MDSPDQRSAIKKLTTTLRRVTRWIQLIPFVYLGVYALSLLTENATPSAISQLLDSTSITPIVTAGFLSPSRLLELCRWHKIACLFQAYHHFFRK